MPDRLLTTEPTTEPTGLTVEVTGPATVTVGSTFVVSVVADNIPEPGVFGYQFWLNWDDAVLAPVTGTLALSGDFPLEGQRDVSANQLRVAASRQGAVEDLTGPLTLLTWTFQANTVTDPNATPLTLTSVKLGRKGGLNVPVDQVINLNVVVIEDDTGNQIGDIFGNVTVEGRAADNQAGHIVFYSGGSSVATEANGNFAFADVDHGVYDFTANSAGFLAAVCVGATHDTSATTLANVTLLAGDINDDGVIDITDATAIGLVFGSTASGEIANLNVDSEVDILDLILMAANYGQTSGDNPWVCQ